MILFIWRLASAILGFLSPGVAIVWCKLTQYLVFSTVTQLVRSLTLVLIWLCALKEQREAAIINPYFQEYMLLISLPPAALANAYC